MGETAMNGLSDRGSTPLSSINESKRENLVNRGFPVFLALFLLLVRLLYGKLMLSTAKCVIIEEGNWVYCNLKQNYSEINLEVVDIE
jgi:hypothetical protein